LADEGSQRDEPPEDAATELTNHESALIKERLRLLGYLD